MSPPLVERPGGVQTTAFEAVKEVHEDLLADVDVFGCAAHALVLDDGGGGPAIGVNGDGLATHGVSVGDTAHQSDGDGNNTLAFILARVVNAARAHAHIVVGDFSRVLAATARLGRGDLGLGSSRWGSLGNRLMSGRGRGRRGSVHRSWLRSGSRSLVSSRRWWRRRVSRSRRLRRVNALHDG